MPSSQSSVVYRCVIHGLVETTAEYTPFDSDEARHMCPVHTGHDDLCFIELEGPITVQEIV